MKNLATYAKYVTFAGIFVLPFVVLVIDYSQVFPFITGKNFLFRVIVELIAGAWLILALLKPQYRPKKSMLLYAVALFVGVMFVANIFGLNPERSFWSNFERMEGWVTLIHLLAYFVVLSSALHTKALWNKFWNTSIVASVVVGLYGILELIKDYAVDVVGVDASEGIWSVLPNIDQGGARVDATLGNATYLAVYMLFHTFLTTLFLLRYKSLSLKMRLWYGAALVLQLYVLYMTATRGAILGVIGGAVIMALIFVVKERLQTLVGKISAGILIVIIVATGAFFALKDSELLQNKGALTRLADISLEDNTTLSRFVMWDIAWEGFKERPILGVGQENFNYVFNAHYNPKLFNQEQWFDRPHNIIFNWLTTGGILGLGAYLFILYAALRLLWTNTAFAYREKAVLTGLLAAYVFQNLFVFDQIISYMLFFAVIAYIHSTADKGVLFERLFEGDQGIKERIIVPVILVATLIVPFAVNASGYLQSQTTIKALSLPASQTLQQLRDNVARSLELMEEAVAYDSFGTPEVREQLINATFRVVSSEQIPQDLKQSFSAFTQNELQRQIEETPRDARYYYLYGRYLAQFGQNEQALGLFQQAAEFSPDKSSILLEIAQVHGRMENYEDMRDVASYTYNLDERNDQAWVVYMLATAFLQDDETFQREFTAATEEKMYKRLILLSETLVRTQPNNPENPVRLIDLLIQDGQYAQAEGRLQKLEEDFPETFRAYEQELSARIEAGVE